MTWIVGLVVAVGLLALVVRAVVRASGEEERIRVFLRVYQQAKRGGASESEALASVCSFHIPPGRGRPLSAYGMTGEAYLKGVFEDEVIDIQSLIALFIRLEFPEKYPMKIDIEEIRRLAQSGKPLDSDLLRERIKQLSAEIDLESR